MRTNGRSCLGRGLGVAAALALAAIPAWGAGFGFFEQGARAMGMGGAFTAQADDPSALFHNVGGLAFLKQRDFYLGTTLAFIGDSTFHGEAPFPGDTASGQQVNQVVYPSHFYYVQPISRNLTFGLGFNSPFGLVTEWDNPDQWAGRFLSTRAELRTFDFNPSLGWQATPKLGLGFGVIYRLSDVTLDRRVAVPSNPYTLLPAEVAKSRLESNLDDGHGWDAGFLYKYNNSFSVGFSYRSKVTVDYGGDAHLTQILTGFPQFDASVAALLPFGQAVPVKTSVEFPDMWSVGVALALSPNMVLEVDYNRTGWSTFKQVAIAFPAGSGLDDQTLPENWKDAKNYRVGFRWSGSSSSEWRFGYIYDETPQPDETVSPLLPDANRNDFVIGYGHKGGAVRFDLALMYVDFAKRTTHTNVNNFNGTYETSAFLLGLSLGF
jgi:long-chain fatty acid transport protein